MIGKDGTAFDGISPIDWGDDFYHHFQQLSLRHHVCIGADGVAKNSGKFDNEVVYKGTRFVFEIELTSDTDKDDIFDQTLSVLRSSELRVGGGVRCGYGKLRMVKCLYAVLDLRKTVDLEAYINKSASLSAIWDRYTDCTSSIKEHDKSGWIKYKLELSPMDFFMFGSGMGDDVADLVPMTECVVEWINGSGSVRDGKVLIPAASVKGALAHRTAYNYNKLNHFYIGNAEAQTGENNTAVRAIFGTSGKSVGERGTRGNIILSDVLKYDLVADNEKLFYHVQIDSFTGGTIDGALFQEKSVYGHDTAYELDILVASMALRDQKVKEAFERSLQDICDGLLPLGGITSRGNGFFTGTIKITDYGKDTTCKI